MKVLEKGHIYQPAVRTTENDNTEINDEAHDQTIIFVNKEDGREHDGTTTQEILRILIDRTRHCNNCLPHPNNERVIYHLRSALILHEARALERKMEKGEFAPEYIETGDDGHFAVGNERKPADLDTPILEPHRQDWDRECKHPKAA